MTTKRWADLTKNDRIVCPGDGVTETVLFNRPHVKGQRFVRTSRHDHRRPSTERVETR